MTKHGAKRWMLFSLAILASSTLGACSVQTVKPWERGELAGDDMQWDPYAAQSTYRKHTEFSKEGLAGGIGIGGGGCGCN